MLQRESTTDGVQQAQLQAQQHQQQLQSQQRQQQSEDVLPYKIQVSTVSEKCISHSMISQKYLDLTRRKLELTRLPHEVLVPKERAWEYGTPKREVEGLVDYWLEAYDWRAREADLNSLLPQFRTNLTPTPPPTGAISSSTSLRIHFTHSPSPQPNAIPLLYLHSSLGLLETTKLIPLLTHPEREADIAFHVVAPSLPGWGFGERVGLRIREVAGLWDGLMVGVLGYNGGYVAVGEGGGWGLPIIRALSTYHSTTCLATHVYGPIHDLQPPSLTYKPFHYLRYSLARSTRASLPLLRFGYTPSDFPLRYSFRNKLKRKSTPPPLSPTTTPAAGLIPQTLQTAEPQTLIYALTDSPAGLLALVLSLIHNKNPNLTLSPRDIIDITMLTWLPGPESLLRWHKDTFPDVPNDVGGTRSDVPMGASIWNGATAIDGAGGGVTSEGNGSEGAREGCPIPWLSTVHSVKWVRRRAGVGGWVVWERAAELVQDWREFFGGVVADRGGGARAMSGSRVVAASAPDTASANEPENLSETVSRSTHVATPMAAPATASEARPAAKSRVEPELAPPAKPTIMAEPSTEPATTPTLTPAAERAIPPTTEPKVTTIPEEVERREGTPH
ncbi:MAG: hypothetical protein M1840_007511 [Geoglossum simile]|nr:MAG: hypothetical protein M1840_007511 [Geoglossum simile]